jgi:hypothetical protein
LKKEYYRLSELSRSTNIHLEDYQYFIENYKETIYFRVHDQPIVLIGELVSHDLKDDESLSWDDLTALAKTLDKEGVIHEGLCVGRYTGLARLSKQDKNTLLREGVVNTSKVIIDDIQGLKARVDSYAFDEALPNQYFSSWGQLNSEDKYGLTSLLVTNTSGELTTTIKSIMFDDLLVPAHAAEHLENLLVPIEDKPHQEDYKTPIVSSRNDDFNDLFIIVVEKHQKLTAKEYWRILEVESEEMEGFRLLDKNNILMNIETNKINWRDRKGKPRKPISFTAFANRLAKIRKEVFI